MHDALGLLKSEARSRSRAVLGASLRRVPTRTVLSLRQGFPSTTEGTVRHEIERRLLEVVRHRGIPDEIEVFAPVDNDRILLVRADSFVTERTYWFGERYGYEPGGIYWWRQFCSNATKVLELGANIGYYTVQGARVAPSARYIAVEPHPGCAATCRRNVHANGLTNVDVIEAAAVPSAETGALTLLLPRGRDHYLEGPSTGFVGKNELHWADADNPRYDSIRVPGVKMASLIDGVDLLKLDVEGLEYELLSSVEAELRSLRPTMFLELLDGIPRLRSFIAGLCENSGYTCAIPTLDGLVPVGISELFSLTVKARSGIRDIVMISG